MSGISLPVQLETPPPLAMRILSLLFAAGVALAILVQAGTSWRVYEFRANVEPAFASTGLVVGRQRFADWTVNSASDVSRAAGVRPDSVIERVDAVPVSRDASYSEVGALLAGADGESVTVRLRSGSDVRDVELVRSAESRAQAYESARRTLADALRASQRNASYGGAIAELKARMGELETAARGSTAVPSLAK